MQTLTTADLTKARKAIADFRNSLEPGEGHSVAVLSQDTNPFTSRKPMADIPEVAQFSQTFASLQSETGNTDPALLCAKAENLLLLLQIIEIKIKTTILPETLHTNAEFERIEKKPAKTIIRTRFLPQ